MKTIKFILFLFFFPQFTFAAWKVLDVKIITASNQTVNLEITAEADSVYRDESFSLVYYKTFQKGDTLLVRPYYFESHAGSGFFRSVKKVDNIFLGSLWPNTKHICIVPYNVDDVDTVTYPPNPHPPNFCYELAELSVENNISNSTFNVYPNPTNDILYIDSKIKVEKIELYEINGRLLKADYIQNNKIQVSNLPKGWYFIKAKVGNTYIFRRFIKE